MEQIENLVEIRKQMWREIDMMPTPREASRHVSSLKAIGARLDELHRVYKKYPIRVNEKEYLQILRRYNERLKLYLGVLYNTFDFPPEMRKPVSMPDMLINMLTIEMIEHRPKWFLDFDNIPDYKDA